MGWMFLLILRAPMFTHIGHMYSLTLHQSQDRKGLKLYFIYPCDPGQSNKINYCIVIDPSYMCYFQVTMNDLKIVKIMLLISFPYIYIQVKVIQSLLKMVPQNVVQYCRTDYYFIKYNLELRLTCTTRIRRMERARAQIF